MSAHFQNLIGPQKVKLFEVYQKNKLRSKLQPIQSIKVFQKTRSYILGDQKFIIYVFFLREKRKEIILTSNSMNYQKTGDYLCKNDYCFTQNILVRNAFQILFDLAGIRIFISNYRKNCMNSAAITQQYFHVFNQLLKKDSKGDSQTIDSILAIMDQIIDDYHLEKGDLESVVYIVGAAGVGKSTLLNYLAGKKLRVVENHGSLQLELQNKNDGVATIGDGYGRPETLYPNIYRHHDQWLTYVDNPGDSDFMGPSQQILNTYIKAYLGQHIGQIQFMVVSSYSTLRSSNGVYFVEYLNEFSRSLVDPQGMKNSITFVFTKVQRNQNQEKTIQMLRKIRYNNDKNLTPTAKSILDLVIRDQRVGLFFAPLDEQINQIYVNPARNGHGEDDQGTGMKIIEVIKRNPFYHNKLGKKLLNLNISEFQTASEIIKSQEKNFKKCIMKNIKSTFLKSVFNFSNFKQLWRLSQIHQQSKIVEYEEATRDQIKKFYGEIGLADAQIQLELKKITFLNLLRGKDQFSVRYGCIQEPYAMLGIQRLLESQKTFNQSQVALSKDMLQLTDPLGYEKIVNYEKHLFKLLRKSSIQRDIAYGNLLRLVGHDFSKMLKPGDKTLNSKMDINHLVSQTNMLGEIYAIYLFAENPYLTSEELMQLFAAFERKVLQYTKQEFFYFDQIAKQAITKIYTNTFIIEKSLIMSYTALNFDSLQYFIRTKQLEYERIIKQKYIALAGEFTTKMDQKIKEGILVAQDLQEQIAKVADKVDEQIKILQEQQNQQNAKKLQRQAPFKIISNILKTMGDLVEFLSPHFGVRAGSTDFKNGLDFIASVSSLLPNRNLNPATYLDMDNGLAFMNVDIVGDAIDGIRFIDPSIPPKDKIQVDIQARKGIDNYTKIIRDNLKIVVAALQNNDFKDLYEKAQSVKKFDKLDTANPVATAFKIAEVVKYAQKDSKKFLHQVENARKDNEEFKKLQKQLNLFIETTFSKFVGQMRKIGSTFIKYDSQPKIMFLEYGFKATLNDIQLYFNSSLKDFKYHSKDTFLQLFNKIDSATQTLSQISSALENYKIQSDLATLIVSSESSGQQVQNRYPGYIDMQKFFRNLVVLKEGNDILNVVKQSAFPTTAFFSYSWYAAVFNERVYVDKIQILMQKLKEAYNSQMLNQYAIGTPASQQYLVRESNMVFATYRNKNAISRFLKGEPIIFLPDIRLSDPWSNALKFSSIGLRLQLVEGSEQKKEEFKKQLQEKILRDCDVEMSSSGHYYYRFNGVYYIMPSCQLLIDQSYNPSIGKINEQYRTVQSGEPMFSPFTTWKLQLKGNGKETASLEEQLKNDLGNLQITLYGTGVYIRTPYNGQPYNYLRANESYKVFETDLAEVPLTKNYD